jgi:hypothetical protein
MSDGHDRTHGPFLALLVFAFLLALIVLLGPDIKRLAAGQLPLGGGRGPVTSGGFDPFNPIIIALDSVGRAVGSFLSRFFP